MSDVTLVVTALDRLDLLRITLESFARYNTYPIEEMLIRDDSGIQGIWNETRELLFELDLPFPFRLLECEQMGQIRSVDTLIAEVKTPYVFHSEDDWEYTGLGFIEECLTILDKKVNSVWIRPKTDGVAVNRGELKQKNGVWYTETIPVKFSFNPHLRKMSDYTPYKQITGGVCYEDSISQHYEKLGLKTLWLDKGYCKHIGGDKPVNRGGLPYSLGIRKA